MTRKTTPYGRTRRRKGNLPSIDRDMIEKATSDYLRNGGKITKIKEIAGTMPSNCTGSYLGGADNFLMNSYQ